jgi:hypothetical protein
MARLHDIKSAIPLTDQTNPSKFPPYEHQEFPKMLVGKDGKNILGSDGEPRMFTDEDEVEEFLEANPELAEEIRANAPDAASRLAQENKVLKDLLAENERLRTANAKLSGTKAPAAVEEDEELEATDEETEEDKAKARRLKRRGKKKPAPLKRLK